MKLYPKTYEDVFTSERSLKKCHLDEVSISDDTELGEYILSLRKAFHELDLELFDKMVKIEWLLTKFCYRGKRRDIPSRYNRCFGFFLDQRFGIFMRNYMGRNPRVISICRPFSTVVRRYVLDLYPNFYEMDPFKEKIEFPFKNIGFEHMFMVYKMDERMEILRYWDSLGYKSIAEFTDWILNWINCHNDEIGYKKYVFERTHGWYLDTIKKLEKSYEGTRT